MTTYYVNQQIGSDLTGDGSASAKWASIARALGNYLPGGYQGPAAAGAGDTVIVEGNFDYHTLLAWNAGTLRPTQHGTLGLPLLIRAADGVRPIISSDGTPAGNSGFQAFRMEPGDSYVTLQGFKFAVGMGAAVIGNGASPTTPTLNPRLLDLEFDMNDGADGNGSGNHDCIFVTGNNVDADAVIDLEVADCFLANSVYGTGAQIFHGNAAGIGLFNTLRAWIHHNYIPNCNTAVFVKRRNRQCIVEYNHIDQMQGQAAGAVLTSLNGFASDAIVRYNLITRAIRTHAFNVQDITTIDLAIEYFNNTLYDVWGGTGCARTSQTTWRHYNNATVTNIGSAATTRAQQVWNTANLPSTYLSDFNRAHDIGTPSTVRWARNGSALTLVNWQASASTPDPNTTQGDPVFAVATPDPTKPTDFKPGSGSPLLNAGRVGGTSGGAVVNIGCYATGSETIGRRTTGPLGNRVMGNVRVAA